MMMIDWLSFKIPCQHNSNILGGQIINLTPDGEIEYTINKRLSVEGSYSSKIQVRSCDFSKEYGQGQFLEISGNPVKFLQGHNIFGTDDLLNLVPAFMFRLVGLLEGLNPSKEDIIKWNSGSYTLSRIDINYMYELGNLKQVQAWLRAAEFKSRTRQGRPSMKGGSLYFHPSSRRWSLVFYAKGEEISVKGRLAEGLKAKLAFFKGTDKKGNFICNSHPPKLTCSDRLASFSKYKDAINGFFLRSHLYSWAQNKLRAEVRLRFNELDEMNLTLAANWRKVSLVDTHRKYLDRIEMTEQVTLPELIEQSLPPKLRMVYIAWKTGSDLKAIHPKNTYYRYRRQLLEYGIDIALIQDKVPDNVIPLVQVLEAQPVTQIPDFARGSSLYFKPPKVAVS